MKSLSELQNNFPAADIAAESDLAEILNLQKLAYLSEAEIYNDYRIAPLCQTLQELQEEAKDAIILKIVMDRRIIGSVRGFEKNGITYIGKLIVHPEYRDKGIGKKLMAAIENCFEVSKYELFTGHLSVKNLALYHKLGYKDIKSKQINENLQLIYLQKAVK